MDNLTIWKDERVQKITVQINALKDLVAELEDQRKAVMFELREREFYAITEPKGYNFAYWHPLACIPEFIELVRQRDTFGIQLTEDDTVYLADYNPTTDSFSIESQGESIFDTGYIKSDMIEKMIDTWLHKPYELPIAPE